LNVSSSVSFNQLNSRTVSSAAKTYDGDDVNVDNTVENRPFACNTIDGATAGATASSNVYVTCNVPPGSKRVVAVVTFEYTILNNSVGAMAVEGDRTSDADPDHTDEPHASVRPDRFDTCSVHKLYVGADGALFKNENVQTVNALLFATLRFVDKSVSVVDASARASSVNVGLSELHQNETLTIGSDESDTGSADESVTLDDVDDTTV